MWVIQFKRNYKLSNLSKDLTVNIKILTLRYIFKTFTVITVVFLYTRGETLEKIFFFVVNL